MSFRGTIGFWSTRISNRILIRPLVPKFQHQKQLGIYTMADLMRVCVRFVIFLYLVKFPLFNHLSGLVLERLDDIYPMTTNEHFMAVGKLFFLVEAAELEPGLDPAG